MAIKKTEDPPPKTIDGLFERYCRETVLRRHSKITYLGVASVFQRDTGITAIADVDHNTVIEWRDGILQRASVMTWNSYRRSMKTVFNFALRNGWIDNNSFIPVKQVSATKLKKTVSKRVMSEMMASLKSDNSPIVPGWFWACAFKLLYYTGMRRRQLTSLRWSHIDFDRKIILLSIEGSKSKREWEIPLPAQCEQDLLDLYQKTKVVRERPEKCQVFCVQLFDERHKGTEMTPIQLTAALRRLSDSIGAVVSPHRLRHTMATDLARGANPDLKSLQYLLGHSNLNTTLEYVNPEMSQLRTQILKLSIDELPDI